jgi:DNA-binding MarR family transcriptional regulator
MSDLIPTRTLGFVASDIARLLRRDFEQLARSRGLKLTRAQWSVLANLARNEGINQASLAQVMEIEPITLVRLLDKLEAAELVERRANPADRRERNLYLTPAAGPLLAEIRVIGDAVRERAMAGLDTRQREQLMDYLVHVRANLCGQVQGRETLDGTSEVASRLDEPGVKKVV